MVEIDLYILGGLPTAMQGRLPADAEQQGLPTLAPADPAAGGFPGIGRISLQGITG